MNSDGPASRLTYEESCRFLQQIGYPDAGDEETIPPIPDHLPQTDDDEPLGISFFRTWVEGDPLENLTLPRTFFSRSKIGPLSFKNTNLSESHFCWNDFNEVNFEDADLSGSDLRASDYNKVRFVRSNLQNADLRLSTFQDCDFTDADVRGAKMTKKQGAKIALSEQQQNSIDWQKSDGDTPRGG
jgi:BTB/POZ domain-containing protein KCTD9